MKEGTSILMTLVREGSSEEDTQAGMISPIEVLRAANKFNAHHALPNVDLSQLDLKGATLAYLSGPNLGTNEEQFLPESDVLDSARNKDARKMCCLSSPCCT